MSRLEELIQELCPDGVEYVPLGSVIARVDEKGKNSPDVMQVYAVSNTKGIVRAEDYRENTVHSENTSNYTVLREGMFAYNPSRLNIGSIAMLKSKTPGLVSPMYIVFSVDTSKISPIFLEYLLKSHMVATKINSLKEEGARFRFDFSRWQQIFIPVPPLPVQKEIVRILDNFTELAAELTAELTARKKQYEHYRDRLLTFDDEVSMEALGEVCEVVAGGTPSKKNSDYWKDGTIKWLGSTVCKNQKTVDEITDYITEKGLTESSAKMMNKETTLIALVGATIGKVAFLPYEAAINQNIAGVYPKDTNKLNPSYVYYVCTTLYPKFLSLTQGSKLAMANLSFIRSLQIPVPNIDVQNKIVYVLDNFDTICNDLTSGLPGEIEARQKQYEYYRDKLLTFSPAK